MVDRERLAREVRTLAAEALAERTEQERLASNEQVARDEQRTAQALAALVKVYSAEQIREAADPDGYGSLRVGGIPFAYVQLPQEYGLTVAERDEDGEVTWSWSNEDGGPVGSLADVGAAIDAFYALQERHKQRRIDERAPVREDLYVDERDPEQVPVSVQETVAQALRRAADSLSPPF